MSKHYKVLDPWDYAGTLFLALIVWIVIDAGFIAGAILFKNQGLSTICAVFAVKVFFDQITFRVNELINGWKEHKTLTKVKEDV